MWWKQYGDTSEGKELWNHGLLHEAKWAELSMTNGTLGAGKSQLCENSKPADAASEDIFKVNVTVPKEPSAKRGLVTFSTAGGGSPVYQNHSHWANRDPVPSESYQWLMKNY